MYYYIYDQFLGDKKFQQTIAKIESRLTDLEIHGKTGRLSLLNNPQELIENEIKKGVKTVVAVGNDTTIGKIINVLSLHPNICMGIIPIGPNQKIAHTLGVPDGLNACDVLASRIIKQVDLGKIKNQYFLSQVEINGKNLTLECDKKYTIEIKEGSVSVLNFNYWSDNHLANPSDGLLEVVVTPKNKSIIKKIFHHKKNNKSFFLSKKIKVTQEQGMAIAKIDDQQTIKTPILIEIANHQLKVIVGKKRNFDLI